MKRKSFHDNTKDDVVSVSSVVVGFTFVETKTSRGTTIKRFALNKSHDAKTITKTFSAPLASEIFDDNNPDVVEKFSILGDNPLMQPLETIH